MTLKVLIVDDEPLARLRLSSLLEACAAPRAEVAGEAASASQAVQWLSEHACDLILLDVQMPGDSGLQLAESLRDQARERGARQPAIVFVTAHGEHALRAFDLEATDYLTKPVRRERLQEALARVERRLTENAMFSGSQATAPQNDDAQVVIVNDRGRVIRVPLAEVLFFKAELKYVTVRTAEHSLVMDVSLSELEQRLGERFLRIHRNALVAKSAVRELQRRMLNTEMGELDPDGAEAGWAVRIAQVDEWIAVSRRQVAAVREALGSGD